MFSMVAFAVFPEVVAFLSANFQPLQDGFNREFETVSNSAPSSGTIQVSSIPYQPLVISKK